ncbi:MAG: uracil-DNA glycosylase family protein [Anaerolineae bacterium]
MGALDELNREVRNCRLCRLAKERRYAVPGEGPDNAKIMLIGEAPGYHEDQQGRPFVGAAGQFLESLLTRIGLSRRDVFICNVIKCRPPENRDPLPDELACCRPYLDRQIELIKPKLIITLGRYSMGLAFQGVSITKIHGTARRIDDVTYVPMFHPAAALHQPKYRSMIEEDFDKLPAVLAEIAKQDAPPPPPPPEPPQQLSLFK